MQVVFMIKGVENKIWKLRSFVIASFYTNNSVQPLKNNLKSCYNGIVCTVCLVFWMVK